MQELAKSHLTVTKVSFDLLITMWDFIDVRGTFVSHVFYGRDLLFGLLNIQSYNVLRRDLF